MKKNMALITIITLLFSLIGCNTDSTPATGSITVSIKDSISRTISSSDSIDAVRYAVEGTGPEGATVSFELNEDSPTWTNSAAIAGDWNFTATAYNASDKAIGEGSSQVTVAPGKRTSVSIQVNEYRGKGTLTITIAGISSDLGALNVCIYNVESETGVLVADKDITNGSATFELDNGYYVISLVCESGKIAMPAPEAVRIMKGDNLIADYTLNNPGGISAIISNGIKPCPEMSITLNSEKAVVGSTVTATAIITPGTYRYSWYVDGERQKSANDNSVDITFAWGGRHKVTCVAYDTKTKVIWSEEITVDVSEPQVNTVSFYSGNRLIETRECIPDSTQAFPSIELGEGFTLAGWKAEGSDKLITDKSFSLSYSEDEYKFYAYIDSIWFFVEDNGDFGIYKNAQLTSIKIPDSLRGIPVTGIWYGAFADCSQITDITIPESVTSIKDRAFENCSGLTEINIPDSVTSIQVNAFNGCSSLKEISIPESVTFIGGDVFMGCSSLTEISVSENSEYFKSVDGVLFSKDGTTLYQYPIAKTDKNYTIPDSVTLINDNAFNGCSSLTDVTIGNSVSSIGSMAFHACSNLKEISFGNSVEYIFDGAFHSCSGLTELVIPDSVKSIGDIAFCNCTNLTSIVISNSCKELGAGALDGCPNLVSITVPDSVHNRGILNTNKEASVTIRKSSGTINSFILQGSSVKSIVIEDGINSIDINAFSNCQNLTDISIPDSVTYIGPEAFMDCYSLETITIPDSITSIGNNAFLDCTSLISVSIPMGVRDIGSQIFCGCTGLTSVSLPESISYIPSNAFLNCSSLKDVILSDSVRYIDNYAFYGCTNLTGIILPSSVEVIQNRAFEKCSGLTSIIIPENVISIAMDAFLDCTQLRNIYIKQSWNHTRLSKEDTWGAPNAIVTWDYTD